MDENLEIIQWLRSALFQSNLTDQCCALLRYGTSPIALFACLEYLRREFGDQDDRKHEDALMDVMETMIGWSSPYRRLVDPPLTHQDVKRALAILEAMSSESTEEQGD